MRLMMGTDGEIGKKRSVALILSDQGGKIIFHDGGLRMVDQTNGFIYVSLAVCMAHNFTDRIHLGLSG